MHNDTIDGKYEILSVLGQGGFGLVHEVKNLATSEKFALKVCTETDEVNIRRFKREVRLMKNIEDDRVMKIIDENLDGDPPYFVMPLANGSLADIMHTLKNNHELALNLFEEISLGIKALHDSGIIHRDIKPENVLLFGNDKIVVSDLGLGKFEKRDSTILTSSSIYMGTEGYIPPEYMMEGGTKNASARGDIYQLGKTLYFILTGEYPSFVKDNILPPSLTYIILKAVRNNPNDRFKNVQEFLEAINTYKLSFDPSFNPLEKFAINLRSVATRYDKKLVEEMLVIIYGLKDYSPTFFEYFDKVPDNILRICSNQMEKDFEPILKEYTNQIKDFVYGNKLDFPYAEIIANKMQLIYHSSKSLDFKVMALRNMLFSSVHFNRFTAIKIFGEIIISIRSNDEAVAISGMLREEIDSFEHLVAGLPKNNLHVAIQAVCNLVDQRIKDKKDKKNNDDVLW